MISDDPENVSHQLRILGICWVLYGVLRLAAAVFLVLFTNIATLMFGALLNRVPDPFTMMDIFHFIYALLIVFSVVCGIVGVLAGIGLLSRARFGPTLAIIAGFLSVSDIPLGTTLGIYTLIALLGWNIRRTIAHVSGAQVSQSSRGPMTMEPSRMQKG